MERGGGRGRGEKVNPRKGETMKDEETTEPIGFPLILPRFCMVNEKSITRCFAPCPRLASPKKASVIPVGTKRRIRFSEPRWKITEFFVENRSPVKSGMPLAVPRSSLAEMLQLKSAAGDSQCTDVTLRATRQNVH